MTRINSAVWMFVIGFLVFDVISLYALFEYGDTTSYTGVVGESIAVAQIQYLGVYGYLLPFLILLLAIAKLRSTESKIVNVYNYALLLAVFVSFLIFNFTLLGSLENLLSVSLFSGVLGGVFYSFFSSLFGQIGTALLSVIGLFSTLVLNIHLIFPKFFKKLTSIKVEQRNVGDLQTSENPVLKKKSIKKAIKKQDIGSLPSLAMLEDGEGESFELSKMEKQSLIDAFEVALTDFKIKGSVVDVVSGPVVTRLVVDLAAGVKVTSIINVANDLARSLKVVSIRVVDVIPGTSSIGVEIPNSTRKMVCLKDVLKSNAFAHSKALLPVALGKDITGKSHVIDLAKTPHLLVAGTTGSGKSVGVNTMIMSLLYKKTPEELRFIMIDPKMLELSVYSGIPHLYSDVITDMSEAFDALKWCVVEMERRYELMSKFGVRNVQSFNEKVRASKEPMYDLDGNTALKSLPSIVVVIDEFADLIMSVGKKIEENICRIAQKSRAAGIHLIVATQRPSVDVITGLIKSNIPSRIGFQVSSKIDSRTVLDQGGAEQLLGNGDMLVSMGGSNKLNRVHGAFVADEEVNRVAAFIKQQGDAEYIELSPSNYIDGDVPASGVDEGDMETYQSAMSILENGKPTSISKIQRHLKIGYNRAARIVENLEENGVLVKDEKGNRVARLQ